MMWKPDPEVDAACKMLGWSKFHRECGKQYLYFDHIERLGGRRSDYLAVAYTLVGSPRRCTEKVAEGRAKTVIGAIAAAYRASLEKGFSIPDAEPHLAMLINPAAAAVSEPEAVAAVDTLDFEDLLG